LHAQGTRHGVEVQDCTGKISQDLIFPLIYDSKKEVLFVCLNGNQRIFILGFLVRRLMNTEEAIRRNEKQENVFLFIIMFMIF